MSSEARLAAADLDEARLGLWRRRPDLSARRRLTWMQVAMALMIVAAAYVTLESAPGVLFAGLHAVLWAVFAAAILLRLFAAGASMAPPDPPTVRWADPLPVYSLLVPLRREAAAVPGLVTALAKLDYPAAQLDIMFIVEADDDDTIAALRAQRLGSQHRIVEVPAEKPRTKPKALNFALRRARGAFVAIFDAEDAPDPRQLRAALDAFAAGGARLGAVQAPLLIDNGETSWLASQFAAEYAIQFRGIVPLFARFGLPPPLGGTSNHFRRTALDEVGAWDPFNVTEDADLGYRLARAGWRIGVIEPPTWEEAPARLGSWLRQRTRWIKGHLQTWLVHMRDPARTAQELGPGGFLAMNLALGGGLLAALAHGPLLVWLAAALILPTVTIPAHDLALLVSGYASAVLAALFAATLERDPRLALSALTMPFYWPLASIAALRAIVEFVVVPHYWAKTDHGLTPRNTPA